MMARNPTANDRPSGIDPDRLQRRAHNRERILKAATDLFFERGYAGTTMAAICKQLGVTKPFVYWYFKDKQEIIDTIAIESALRIVASMDGAAEDGDPAQLLRDGLRRLVRANLSGFRANSFYSREPAALSATAAKQVRALAARFHRKFADLIDRAIAEGALPSQDPRLAALAVAGVVGFMYTWYRPGGRLSQYAVEQELLRVMLRGIGLESQDSLVSID